MTNEYAIIILNSLKQYYNDKNEDSYVGFEAEDNEALDMAIKALEQESITWIVGKDNCQVAVRNMPIDKMHKICAIIGDEELVESEDCISRKEAINVVHYYFQHYLDVNDDICLDGIRTLPSVQLNRQKMCWKDRKSFLERWECPCCGHTETCKENFCKICGADMRGDTDETN